MKISLGQPGSTAGSWIIACLLLTLASAFCYAQENYEIQVYGSETVEPGKTMVEIHSNFTFKGRKTIENGEAPTHHAWHETLEITHGFNSWFETGLYVFSSARVADGWDFVGTHIRPRVRAPEKWKLPVGLSLSAEIGYQRRVFSADTWTMELRPIIDKEYKSWYFAFNPTFEKSFKGDNASKGWDFSPNVKISKELNKKVSFGLEYYGSLGPVTGFDPISEQQQQFIPAFDFNLSPNWELNFGIGVGVTAGTDHLLAKVIVGRRFSFGGNKKAPKPVRIK